MRVCFWGSFDRSYARHQILARGLQENGVEIFYCHEAVWQRSADKTKDYGGIFGKFVLAFQLSWAYFKLIFRYFFVPRHDVMLVGFLGHFDMIVARLLTLLFRRKLVFDAFISLYDTSVQDRALIPEKSITARFLKGIDRLSCWLADLVLLDTAEHVDYFVTELACRRSAFLALPVGANDAVYSPSKVGGSERPGDSSLNVLLYCKFAPLHGVETVLGAARILEQKGVGLSFQLIGEGQTRGEMEALAREWSLRSVQFQESVDEATLVKEMEAADLLLGIFGATEKAKRVVPNKIYQGMAMGKAMITGRSSAVEAVLTHKETVFFCEMADPESLADALEVLAADPELRAQIGAKSRQLYLENYTPAILGEVLKKSLRGLAGGSAGGT